MPLHHHCGTQSPSKVIEPSSLKIQGLKYEVSNFFYFQSSHLLGQWLELAKLVEWSFKKPEVSGSNPIGNSEYLSSYCNIEKTEIMKARLKNN